MSPSSLSVPYRHLGTQHLCIWVHSFVERPATLPSFCYQGWDGSFCNTSNLVSWWLALWCKISQARPWWCICNTVQLRFREETVRSVTLTSSVCNVYIQWFILHCFILEPLVKPSCFDSLNYMISFVFKNELVSPFPDSPIEKERECTLGIPWTSINLILEKDSGSKQGHLSNNFNHSFLFNFFLLFPLCLFFSIPAVEKDQRKSCLKNRSSNKYISDFYPLFSE